MSPACGRDVVGSESPPSAGSRQHKRFRSGRWLGALTLCLAQILAPPTTAASRLVDLELVLAVDVSSSVNRQEYALQMRGLAEAFRSAEVLEAIAAFAPKGVAVTLMQWGGLDQQGMSVPWQLVHDAASAEAMAAGIDRALRLTEHSGTALGEALRAAGQLFDGNAYDGARRVIDVSGDGHSNLGVGPEETRTPLLAAGIVINGLVILNEEPDLDRYYLSNVIGGANAFVLSAADFDDFARAIRAKLVREIVGQHVAGRPPASKSAAETARLSN
jgi:Protein of unknown function (DUF1194)